MNFSNIWSTQHVTAVVESTSWAMASGNKVPWLPREQEKLEVFFCQVMYYTLMQRMGHHNFRRKYKLHHRWIMTVLGFFVVLFLIQMSFSVLKTCLIIPNPCNFRTEGFSKSSRNKTLRREKHVRVIRTKSRFNFQGSFISTSCSAKIY